MSLVRYICRWLLGLVWAPTPTECCGQCLETYPDTLGGLLEHLAACRPLPYIRAAIAELDDETPEMPQLGPQVDFRFKCDVPAVPWAAGAPPLPEIQNFRAALNRDSL